MGLAMPGCKRCRRSVAIEVRVRGQAPRVRSRRRAGSSVVEQRTENPSELRSEKKPTSGPTTSPLREVMTAQELADYLHVHVGTVERLARRRNIPHDSESATNGVLRSSRFVAGCAKGPSKLARVSSAFPALARGGGKAAVPPSSPLSENSPSACACLVAMAALLCPLSDEAVVHEKHQNRAKHRNSNAR